MHSPPGPGGSTSFEGSSTSTDLHSVFGTGRPMVPILRFPSKGFPCEIGAVSDSPYPSTSTPPVTASNCSCTSSGSGAAPEKQNLIDVMSVFERLGWLSMLMYSVGTPGN